MFYTFFRLKEGLVTNIYNVYLTIKHPSLWEGLVRHLKESLLRQIPA